MVTSVDKTYKIVVIIIITALLCLLLRTIFCPSEGITRIAMGRDSLGNSVYIVEIYSGILSEAHRGGDHAGDWCACGWSRIDFHDYYTLEDAQKALKRWEQKYKEGHNGKHP